MCHNSASIYYYLQVQVMMWLLFLVFGAASGMDMCQRCSCMFGVVDCSKGKMKQWNGTVWDGIINVDEFLLDFNGIVNLRAFPVFGAKKLSLRHNSISVIEDSAFRFVSGLVELDIGYNLLTYHSLNPHIFRGDYSPGKYQPLKNLEVLRLSGNIIHSLRSDLFEHLPNLKRLYLDSNPFKIIDQSTSLAISSVYYLEVLDLSSTMLASFPTSVLHTPKYLKVLNFSSNHFTSIPQAIEETHSLEEFVIDDNIISEIRSFPNVPTLKVLRMNWMPSLRRIESRALSNLTRLEELYCSYNRHLTEIADDAFVHPPIGLEETNIWPPLKKLYLKSNNLAYLDNNIASRWDKFEEIDIQVNPWVCDCENQWMLTTLIPQINRTNKHLTTEIICNEPPEMLNIPMLELSEKKEKMRCLDIYGNRPEKDARLLVSIFICVLILIPIAMAAIVILSYRMRRQSYMGNIPYKHIINDHTTST